MHHTVAVRRIPRRPMALLVGPLAVSLALTACSDDGRTLAPPRPDQTTTTVPAPILGASADGSTAFELVLDGVPDGGELPAVHGCYGEGVSPGLRWANVPADATSLALVVRDRDAGGRVQWLVTGIDPTVRGFADGAVPEGAVEQANATGAIGWDPPCPSQDTGRHIYDLVLHVLRVPVDIDPAEQADVAARQVEDASQEEAPIALTMTPPAQGLGSTEPE
jgi:phosphatidylethanolamine-binding protein (PEBP) family uncharacterized protein